MSCQLFTPDGCGGCCWCRAPEFAHRFVPCPRCDGFPMIPDPRDRSGVRMEVRRRLRCGCAIDGATGGWLVAKTGRTATDGELEAVGWRRPGTTERTAA